MINDNFLNTAHKTCHSTHYFFTKIKNRFKQQSTCTKESFNQIKNEQKMERKIRKYTCKMNYSGMQIMYQCFIFCIHADSLSYFNFNTGKR